MNGKGRSNRAALSFVVRVSYSRAMVTSNRGLIVALCSQAAISAAASSAALASLAPEKVVAGVTLLNAMLSAGTAVYVALTGQKVPPLPAPPPAR